MTERFQQLSEQAKKSVPHGLSPDKWIEVYNEKFAELVIQDSIQTLRNNGYDDAAQCLHDVHFGIADAP